MSRPHRTKPPALEERPGENNYIATVPGRGYQFLLPVKIIGDGTPALSTAPTTGTTHVLMQQRTISEHRVTHPQ